MAEAAETLLVHGKLRHVGEAWEVIEQAAPPGAGDGGKLRRYKLYACQVETCRRPFASLAGKAHAHCIMDWVTLYEVTRDYPGTDREALENAHSALLSAAKAAAADPRMAAIAAAAAAAGGTPAPPLQPPSKLTAVAAAAALAHPRSPRAPAPTAAAPALAAAASAAALVSSDPSADPCAAAFTAAALRGLCASAGVSAQQGAKIIAGLAELLGAAAASLLAAEAEAGGGAAEGA